MIHRTGLIALACLLLLVPACFNTVSEQERVKARVNYDLGVAAMQQGNLADAIRKFKQSVHLNPKLPQVHNALGLAYHTSKKIKASEHHYKKAIELKPDFSEAINNYGVLLMDVGRYEEALPLFAKVLEDIMYPTPFYAEGNLGWAQFKLGQYAKARSHMKNAIASNPQFCRGYLWLSNIERQDQRYQKAHKALERFFTMCIDKPKVRKYVDQAFLDEADYEMGMLLVRFNQRDKAKKHLQRCLASEIERGIISGRCQQAIKMAQ